MPHPWIASQKTFRNTDPLNVAADQYNLLRTIADTLHAQGRDHHHNPAWQTAAAESHRLQALADTQGHDEYAVTTEADRRRPDLKRLLTQDRVDL